MKSAHPEPRALSLSKGRRVEGRELENFLKTTDPRAVRPPAPPPDEPRYSSDAMSAREPALREWLAHVLAGRIGS